MSSSPESRDEAREKALAAFMEYFRTNYPGPDTIISRPDWHAPKIFRAVEYALKDAGLVASRSERAKPDDDTLAARLVEIADSNSDLYENERLWLREAAAVLESYRQGKAE
jgi:hypothetical protein